ncbi:heme o synthase [Buchnera aphidicola]|uniref:Protoheme IX farnesyltransferase n=1 Tax=Buchnera aphidicola subsp. Melaphis rhois TaxID=118103 RepID=A0A4D6Y392_BUCMH|nr:heme o synthase [Buchnera aphidicola]QCI23429.1 protoheme IX farnesyltransferase [Buchnera aphidicola (Melaphis rhois)]
MIMLLFGLLKPRIVFGNSISSLGGFLLASKGNVNYYLLFLNLISISLVVSSACILNNVIDYKIDQRMNRTKNRILVINSCFYNLSIYISVFLGIFGLFLYGWFFNLLCVLLASCALIIYIVFYSLYLKMKSRHSTIIGSLSGAIPPILGYCSVVNHINLCMVNLFIIFFIWQIPHSYSIFVKNLQDYKNAKIPVFPAVKPFLTVRYHVNIFILLFLMCTCSLTIINCTGYKFFYSLLILSLIWFYLSIKKYKNDKEHIIWSKNVFYCSILIMFIMNIMISIDFID